MTITLRLRTIREIKVAGPATLEEMIRLETHEGRFPRKRRLTECEWPGCTETPIQGRFCREHFHEGSLRFLKEEAKPHKSRRKKR